MRRVCLSIAALCGLCAVVTAGLGVILAKVSIIQAMAVFAVAIVAFFAVLLDIEREEEQAFKKACNYKGKAF